MKFTTGVLAAFVPSYRAASIEAIDWSWFAAQGHRVVALDIDNTLMPHGARTADARARACVAAIMRAGLQVWLCSNAKTERAMSVARSLSVPVIPHIRKPNADALLAALDRGRISPASCLVVGDQLMTDVWMANRCQVTSIWVPPLSAAEWVTIRIKRGVERLLMVVARGAFLAVPTAPEPPDADARAFTGGDKSRKLRQKTARM